MINFVLRDEDGNEHGAFAEKQSLQAALKAAKRGNGTKSNPEIIRLRACLKIQTFLQLG